MKYWTRIVLSVALVAVTSCAGSLSDPAPLPLSESDESFLNGLSAADSTYTKVANRVFMKHVEKKEDDASSSTKTTTVTMKNDIKTHFKGYFPDGSVFDSSHERGAMMQVPVSHTLQGWQKALVLMKEGDKVDVCMGPEYAFGQAGAPPHVGSNRVVCYEIHLEEVLEGDQHHYIHPDYAEQYREYLKKGESVGGYSGEGGYEF